MDAERIIRALTESLHSARKAVVPDPAEHWYQDAFRGVQMGMAGLRAPQGGVAAAPAPPGRVAEALMKLAPYRKQLGPDSYGGRIYRGDDYIGWADTSSPMPGKIKVDYIGAGTKENPTMHFENSMNTREVREIGRQLEQYWQAQNPEAKLMIGGHRVGGARVKSGAGPSDMEISFKPALGGIVAGPSLLELLRGGDRRPEQGL